jgi:transposase-like protein
MVMTTQPKTLAEAIRHYASLDVCQTALVEARWPDGVTCPTCGSANVGYLANQRRWQCKAKPYHPKRQFSAKVGTIFEDSPISLPNWFVAIWLIASAKNGISSYELSRAIGVTQKTAWFMLQRIRLAMQTKSFDKMGGHVEADETFIGGKARNMHAAKRRQLGISQSRSMIGKVAVMGLLERHKKDEGSSQVRFKVIANRKKHQLEAVITENVTTGASIYTDALKSYDRMGGRGYVHAVIDHAESYVDGQVHTNGLENFWSLLKRALKGTYVSVEPFHLFRYLDEQAYRFNTRKQKDGERFADTLHRVFGKRLTYAELTGEMTPAEVV